MQMEMYRVYYLYYLMTVYNFCGLISDRVKTLNQSKISDRKLSYSSLAVHQAAANLLLLLFIAPV